LEQAGFEHEALVEIDADATRTLRFNRPAWDVRGQDLNAFDGREFAGAELFAGGLPCPPFSVAGKKLGENDERNLFPAALRLVDEIRPKAIMIENVKGIFEPSFEQYRKTVLAALSALGYHSSYRRMLVTEGIRRQRFELAIRGPRFRR
jgi:DNA (cytosine-5)-methyltransferase 1